ncbi:hypothetical protein, partial [Acetobacter okinawensis]|uniref:hypothetical protein n=1 Tax=Acetobacter okinawensis TaxID=1076594 RepID=UPI001BAAC61F
EQAWVDMGYNTPEYYIPCQPMLVPHISIPVVHTLFTCYFFILLILRFCFTSFLFYQYLFITSTACAARPTLALWFFLMPPCVSCVSQLLGLWFLFILYSTHYQ